MLRLLIFLSLIALAWLIWRFVIRGDAIVLVRPGQPAAVSARLSRFVARDSMVIGFQVHSGRHRINEISLTRALAEALGLRPPDGFVVEDLPLSNREQSDPAMRAFVADYNRDNLRWVGRFELAAEGVTELAFPLSAAEPVAGSIQLTYESKLGTGSSMSFLRVATGGVEGLPAPVDVIAS